MVVQSVRTVAIVLSAAIIICGLHSAAVRSINAAEVETPIETDVFVSGTSGYHTFRIPSLIVAKNGALLAFAEGRKKSRSDTGDIDLVLRRSKDNGRTWSPLEVIVDDEANTVGNPCPVVDQSTGFIWLLLTRNPGVDDQKQIMAGKSTGSRTVLVTCSRDNGLTWDKPVDITQTVKDANWGWYATGPGVGIQLASGRLVIPCDHSVLPTSKLYSHVIYSDDHGKSWSLGGALPENTDECQVVELADKSLLLNMRSFHGKNRRAIARSTDGGASWGEISFDAQLIEPVCQGSLLRLSLADHAADGSRNRLLFANPADKKRQNLTVRVSEDEGATWPIARRLYEGSSAYCCLAVLPGEQICCLYERDEYKKITLARFSLSWLLAGRYQPAAEPAKP